jgi:hypothetical protein
MRSCGRTLSAVFPVATQRGGQNFLGFCRLGAHVIADRRGAGDDVVAQRAEALDLDLDHVAREHDVIDQLAQAPVRTIRASGQ